MKTNRHMVVRALSVPTYFAMCLVSIVFTVRNVVVIFAPYLFSPIALMAKIRFQVIMPVLSTDALPMLLSWLLVWSSRS